MGVFAVNTPKLDSLSRHTVVSKTFSILFNTDKKRFALATVTRQLWKISKGSHLNKEEKLLNLKFLHYLVNLKENISSR